MHVWTNVDERMYDHHLGMQVVSSVIKIGVPYHQVKSGYAPEHIATYINLYFNFKPALYSSTLVI